MAPKRSKPASTPRGRQVATIPCPGLRPTREARGLSQAQVAELLELKPQQRTRIAMWEKRNLAPKADLERLAALLELPLAALTTAADEDAAKAELRASVEAFGEAFRRVSAAVRRFL